MNKKKEKMRTHRFLEKEFYSIFSIASFDQQALKFEVSFLALKNGGTNVLVKGKKQKIYLNQKILKQNSLLPLGWRYKLELKTGVLVLSWACTIPSFRQFLGENISMVTEVAQDFLRDSLIIIKYQNLIQDIIFQRVGVTASHEQINCLVQYTQAASKYCWREAKQIVNKNNSIDKIQMILNKREDPDQIKYTFPHAHITENYQQLKQQYLLSDAATVASQSFSKVISGTAIKSICPFLQEEQDQQIKQKYLDSAKLRLQKKYKFTIDKNNNISQSIQASLENTQNSCERRLKSSLKQFYTKNKNTLSLTKKISILSQIIDWLYVFREQQSSLHLNLSILKIMVHSQLKIDIFELNEMATKAKYIMNRQQSYQKCQVLWFLGIVYQILTGQVLNIKPKRTQNKENKTQNYLSHNFVLDPQSLRQLSFERVLLYLFFKVLNTEKLNKDMLQEVPYMEWMTIIMNSIRQIHAC